MLLIFYFYLPPLNSHRRRIFAAMVLKVVGVKAITFGFLFFYEKVLADGTLGNAHSTEF